MEKVEVEVEVEVPSYFVCPISLEIMRDPVILPSGITYDRQSIERWIFADGKTTCPVTRLPLPLPADDLDLDLTPNHTLRRLIQAWSALHSSERFPTPKPPLDKHSVSRLLQESSASRHHLLSCLRKLKALVSEGERNRRCVESTPGAVEFLASVVASAAAGDDAECDVAIDVLASLKLSERRIVEAVAEKNPEFVDALVGVLRRPYYPSRAHAVAILRSLAGALSPARLAALGEDLFREVVRVLRDRVSQQATKAALQALVELAPWGRNRVKAVSAGAVEVVVEILLEGPDRRTCELALAAAERLCGCAEGRAALARHPAGVAAVAKKALRVSHAATDRAVRALCAVARHAPAAAVLAEMASVGAVAKLCLVLQSPDCGDRTKERVREVLRLHSRVWRSSPCLSPQFLALYPPPSSSSSSSTSSSS
ncbi:E3 ubiquitin-protein ligase PUB23 [Ananas comosus]|uniref:U-box domain-containing protein n=1 Tax=Ananas comosus TaxID=4615 RepID=A0A199VTW0_ANACO|nr:E3 ubiquitin-protein ligase PUB23 [Ananas comosus]